MGRRDFLVGWTMITIPTRCIQTSFFAAWLIIGMIRTFCSAFIVVLYPLCESSAALSQIVGGIIEVGVPFEPLCSDAVELFFFSITQECVGCELPFCRNAVRLIGAGTVC